jgi:hypothetical protein
MAGRPNSLANVLPAKFRERETEKSECLIEEASNDRQKQKRA